MSAPGRRWSSSLADWPTASAQSAHASSLHDSRHCSRLAVSRRSKCRLSLLSPVLGETDAPAPVRAKEWARERGRVRISPSENVLPGGIEPLTLILSPWRRGEAKQTAWN